MRGVAGRGDRASAATAPLTSELRLRPSTATPAKAAPQGHPGVSGLEVALPPARALALVGATRAARPAARGELDAVTARVVETTSELVRIPSQGGIDDPTPICKAMARALRAAGLEPEILTDPSGRPAGVVAEIAGALPGPTYALNAVVDTAPAGDPSQWATKKPFEPVLDGPWLIGRGVADSKAAAAIFVEVGRIIAARRESMHGRAVLFFDAAEHTGEFQGIEAFLARYPKVDAMVIGYPGNEGLHVGSRGFYRAAVSGHLARPGAPTAVARAIRASTQEPLPQERTILFPLTPKLTITAVSATEVARVEGYGAATIVDVRIAGKAAHSGSSSTQGVNGALKTAALLESEALRDSRVLHIQGGAHFSQVPDRVDVRLALPGDARGADEVREELSRLLAALDAEMPGGGASQVTVVATGAKVETAVSRIVTHVDMRTTPSFDGPRAEQHLGEALGAASQDGLRLAFEERGAWPAFVLDENSPVRRAMESGIARVTGQPAQAKISGPSNVGNLLAAHGVPATTGYGVRAKGAHSANEAIDVRTIGDAYRVHVAALEALLFTKPEPHAPPRPASGGPSR